MGSAAFFVVPTDDIRDGLTSSVDILPMLVTIGNGGNRNGLTGNYAQL